MITQNKNYSMLWAVSFLIFAGFLIPVCGENVFYSIPVQQLKIIKGKLPEQSQAGIGFVAWHFGSTIIPYAVISGQGEAYISLFNHRRWGNILSEVLGGSLCIRAPEGKKIKGRIFIPRPDPFGKSSIAKDHEGWIVSFTIPKASASKEAEIPFYKAKLNYYQFLLDQNLPGAAWFRHQADSARKKIGKPGPGSSSSTSSASFRPDLNDTYSLFSGGRALSENLQLDRILGDVKDSKETVDINTLKGITIKELDWKRLIKDKNPERDFLASFIPHDQYAVFFPSFSAMIRLMDESDANGTPVLQLFEARCEDSHTRDRIQKQLCLEVNELSRLFGSKVIKSVAITGSDTYLRTGSDISVLFEAKQQTILTSFILQKYNMAAQSDKTVKKVSGDIGGIKYTGVISPFRNICSYLFCVDNVCIVTNSLNQVKSIGKVVKEKTKALGSLDEYTYFRSRYLLGNPDESALVILTDAAIRRLCSPRWRIATSRRTRVAAVMSELQTSHAHEIIRGKLNGQGRELDVKWKVPGAGIFKLTSRGIVSSIYNTLEFMTPIAEIPMIKVTKKEAESYRRWRSVYQTRWRRYFDPVGIRFTINDNAIGADVSVMPLIMGTEYREFVELTKGVELKPFAGDPHNSLLQYIMAVNTKSSWFRMASGFLQGMSSKLGANPFNWLGKSLTIYADDSPFWEDLEKAKNMNNFMEKQFYRLPVAIRFDVVNSLKLTVFLTSLRVMANQSAPGLTVWETLSYKKQPYVKISASENNRNMPHEMAIYYVATPGFLVVTLSEKLLKDALDRKFSKDKNKKQSGKPWLAKSINFRVKKKAIFMIQKLFEDDYRKYLCRQSWSNIPILNEMKRAFRNSNPNEIYTKLWQSELLCPGGGVYKWNRRWQTVESTVYGHPGKALKGPSLPTVFDDITGGDLGLTFDGTGLRAIVEINRSEKK